ncbi:transcriptional regulator ATRX homolog isoform X1 [Clinocottus analis]|uniref:transcriptional regulator ATRX homolog isoform X1 n=1 Tax=Clinocottus analis TaxID=304258 RepID=UPI0035BFC41F
MDFSPLKAPVGAGAAGVQQPAAAAAPPGGLKRLDEEPEPEDPDKLEGKKCKPGLPAGAKDGKQLYSCDSSLSSSDSEDEGIGKKDKKKKKKLKKKTKKKKKKKVCVSKSSF